MGLTRGEAQEATKDRLKFRSIVAALCLTRSEEDERASVVHVTQLICGNKLLASRWPILDDLDGT